MLDIPSFLSEPSSPRRGDDVIDSIEEWVTTLGASSDPGQPGNTPTGLSSRPSVHPGVYAADTDSVFQCPVLQTSAGLFAVLDTMKVACCSRDESHVCGTPGSTPCIPDFSRVQTDENSTRRRLGRPKGSRNKSTSKSRSTLVVAKRRRGRPKGSKNKTKSTLATDVVSEYIAVKSEPVYDPRSYLTHCTTPSVPPDYYLPSPPPCHGSVCAGVATTSHHQTYPYTRLPVAYKHTANTPYPPSYSSFRTPPALNLFTPLLPTVCEGAAVLKQEKVDNGSIL